MAEPTDDTQPEWLQLEAIVADIQKALAPGATVTHNATLWGHGSETNRQIDVLIEQSIGPFNMKIVVDCKDYKRPVDVKGVEEFIGLVKDVHAHQGCLVSAKGFSTSARKLAKKRGIGLFTLVDTAPHKWQTKVSMPVVCEYRGAAISFRVSISSPVPWKLQYDFVHSLMLHDEQGNLVGSPMETALNRWNNGEFPTGIGEHKDIPLLAFQPHADNGYGALMPLDLTVSLRVKSRRYFGMLPLESVRGLRDEHTGTVVTNAFTTGELDHVEVQNQWKQLDDTEEPPQPPGLVFMGLDCYEIQGTPI